MKKIISIFFCLIINSMLSQERYYTKGSLTTFTDSTKSYYNNKFQSLSDKLIKEGFFNPEKDKNHTNDILPDEIKARLFAIKLIRIVEPQIKEKVLRDSLIFEDKTSKLWFIYFRIPNSLDGSIYLIVSKNNCKVIYFSGFI